jgi:hypothetical protein
MRDIVILLYAGLGTRVAIVDLRAPRSNYRLTPGQPLQIRGVIHSLPLVEGDYSVGLYIDCGDFSKDVYDLTRLSIVRTETGSELSPRHPQHRGVLELSYEYSADQIANMNGTSRLVSPIDRVIGRS